MSFGFKKNGLLSLLILFFSFTSCEEPTSSDSESNNASVTLSVADVSCTEAWLRVTAEGVNLNNGAELTLLRDDTVRSSFPIYSADTVIYDEGLLPSKTYRYTAKLTFTPTQTNGSVTKESNVAEAVTMDTTGIGIPDIVSTFVVGIGSTTIYDIAIINENDIWAVGEIHTSWTDQYDSNGVWVQPYNAVHWNGEEWELKRIADVFFTCSTVYAFNENDVWFDGTIKWDGENYSVHMNGFPLLPNGDGWRINSMWGVSSDDFYVVGNGGNIAHYKNGTWTKVEYVDGASYSDVFIENVRGDYNEITGKYEVYAVTNRSPNWQTPAYVIKIEGDNAIVASGGVYPTSGHADFEALWFDAPFTYRIVGRDIWKAESGYGLISPQSWTAEYIVSDQYRTVIDIDGSAKNNIWATGTRGEILKYNGRRWKSYRYEFALFSYECSRVAVKGNLVALACNSTGSALLKIFYSY